MTSPDNESLAVLIEGEPAGLIEETNDGRYRFSYDRRWLTSETATPLSLSMPLAVAVHDDPVVRPYLAGLLPDNIDVLRRWAQTYEVSATNPFALLRHVGEDCAGAVQFVRHDRVAAVLAGEGEIEWIDEEEVGRRLRDLRRDPAAWHATVADQFSLAGAQAKVALQALGIPPEGKYQVDGGPGPERTIDLLTGETPDRDVADRDVMGFVEALALNWVLAGTDAHAKNYSLLLARRRVRLAPLYDVASFLPYGAYVPKLKLAMRIGGEYRLGRIEGRHWRRLAVSSGLDGDAVIERIGKLVAALPAAVDEAASAPEVRELGSKMPERLVEAVAARAGECERALGSD